VITKVSKPVDFINSKITNLGHFEV